MDIMVFEVYESIRTILISIWVKEDEDLGNCAINYFIPVES